MFEINSFESEHVKNVYFPFLVLEGGETFRPPSSALMKKYCCSYAFTNPVKERESLFRALRKRDSTCYSFGSSCSMKGSRPFELGREARGHNGNAFRDFGFMVAMENCVKPGYITEKIGFAFQSSTVPIYDGRNGIERFFNKEAMIDVSDYVNAEQAAETIVEIWRDKHKLQRYLDAPIRINSNLSEYEHLHTKEVPPLWTHSCIQALRDTFYDL
jgi:hypothetical protein